MEPKDWLPLVTSGLGATVFGFVGAYVAVIGRNLATKNDTEFLNKQLSENTKITKSLEQQFSQEDFLRRRELDYRERQLSEFYGPVYGYLKSQKDIYDLWIEGKLQEKNWDVKKYFTKQNALIRDLIISKRI